MCISGNAAAVIAAARAAAAAVLKGSDLVRSFGNEGFTVAEPDETGSSCEGSIVDVSTVPDRSLLDTALLAMWEERAEMGLFR